MKRTILNFLGLFAAVLFVADAQAQSPAATATGKANGATITINYSSPSVKGRKIWGELVPYGKVWRAGANQATTIEFDKDVTVEGKKVPKGKYSLYALPGEKEWSIILNSQTGQWGITRGGETTRDASKDVAVVTVKPKKSASMTEALKYEVNNNGFSLIWENLEVPVTVK
jgi:hypothetical protein